jgi:hypothetical protein
MHYAVIVSEDYHTCHEATIFAPTPEELREILRRLYPNDAEAMLSGNDGFRYILHTGPVPERGVLFDSRGRATSADDVTADTLT